MNYFSPIFSSNLKLYLGTNSQKIYEYPTFLHNQGIFNDPWYNYIVPITVHEKLDKKAVEKIIKKQTEQGKKVSYLINQRLLSNYQSFLQKKGYINFGDDVYLVKKIDNNENYSLPAGYALSTDYELDEVIKVLEKCFPDWPEEKQYSHLYEKYKQSGQLNRLFETFCITYQGKIVAAASIVLDQSLDLAYLHNAGVLPAHRRKKLHTTLIKVRNNYAFEHGVTQVLSITEKNVASYYGFKKLGFEVLDQFFIFSEI